MPQTKPTTAVATCAVEVRSTGAEVQLFPAGDFRGRDGRPKDAPIWRMNSAIARRLVAEASTRQTPHLIDYEHQTLRTEKNGQPAPRAASFTGLEWREGQGLYATGVAWTNRAREYIDAGEYGYISPVFSYSKQTGEVLQLLHAGLTNDPALDGMDAVALSAHFKDFNHPENDEMTLDEIRKALGLPDDADEGAVTGAIAALKTERDDAVAARQALDTEVAALKTAAPDPSSYAPVSVVTALQTEVAALKANQTADQVDGLVRAGLDDGRILPGLEDWARDLGQSNVAALRSFLDSAKPIAALKGSQTGGAEPAADGKTGLTGEQLAVCTQMGLDQDAYAKTLEENAA